MDPTFQLEYDSRFGPRHRLHTRLIRTMQAKTLPGSPVAKTVGSAHGPNRLWAETSDTLSLRWNQPGTSNKWCLTFNIRMHRGKDNPKFQYTMTTEKNNIVIIVLAKTVQEKDLGSTNNLKWEKQVVAVTQQAMVVLRSVKRAFIHFDRETCTYIYTYIHVCKAFVTYA